MWIVIRADEREMTFVSTADTQEDANKIIYNELLDIYDGDIDEMNEDIKYNDADISNRYTFAWSNRNGNHDIKAFRI